MGKKYKIKFTDVALEQAGKMSPADIRELGKVLEQLAENPYIGEPMSDEEVRELIAKGILPEELLCEEGANP